MIIIIITFISEIATPGASLFGRANAQTHLEK